MKTDLKIISCYVKYTVVFIRIVLKEVMVYLKNKSTSRVTLFCITSIFRTHNKYYNLNGII